MVYGNTHLVLALIPLLGKPYTSYPRFRNCFSSDEEHSEYDDMIHVYMRVGGGNRESYEEEIEEMKASPYYVADFDDSFDNTYCTFVFEIPEEYKADLPYIKSGEFNKTSKAYLDKLCEVHPDQSHDIKREGEYDTRFNTESK